MSTAFIFPGQGSQSVGMGKALAETFPAARMVFEEVDAALGEKLT
ncbi:MAG TPA: malonyl CoA-acyl carrier protein transacylase, partial [Bradyrhizobium sp.]|nr:malonyl CoA-acyl carrier protein transacylase [Bradyrhizobium sp.]